MQTIIAVMHDGIDETQIRRAGDILKEGGLVAFPTETVYGLGGNALDAQASAKIYAAKGRTIRSLCISRIGMRFIRSLPRFRQKRKNWQMHSGRDR